MGAVVQATPRRQMTHIGFSLLPTAASATIVSRPRCPGVTAIFLRRSFEIPGCESNSTLLTK